MNNMRVTKLSFLSLLVLGVVMQGCGLFGGGGSASTDNGELIGVLDREGWQMTRPFGMVSVTAGTFHMGQADEDVAATQINYNKQVTINAFFMDDTEITNNEYRQFTEELTGPEADIPAGYTVADLIPDTTVWVRDFTHHMGDPMMVYYWSHPAFDDYPVVGVDWNAARYFCNWRTEHMNSYRQEVGLAIMPQFRLPSEAEWEYASRGGRDMNKYPWGNPYIRNMKGCLLANFKPGRGNYFDDGFAYTAPTATYFANDYGLYDMSGNVAEWCEDAYNPSSVPLVWDLNPTYYDDRIDNKVLRGGSWKDIAYYLETGTRSFEHRDTARSSIGFRCAMTYIGRSAGYEF
ncbi:MAG: SUMF1/EgtB/PvdO family nonheme iron enzyme [Cyclobacteriaceae bacterium]